MNKIKYTKEDVLKEMEQALNEKETVTKQPNALKGLLAKAKLGKK
jgi:hypothetical protein